LNKDNEYAHYLASLAQRAILYEVSTTPKPGLVDRENSGAHKDMDFFTFMASSSALYKGLYECALEGILFQGTDSTVLMDKIRIPGISCEKDMFKATKSINTHKGIIFSLGVILAAVGKLYKETDKEVFLIEDICNEVKIITKGLTKKDFNGIENKEKLTHGERLYVSYGYKGIRGEAESGFSTVLRQAIPLMRDWKIKKDLSMNDLFLHMLINIMAESEDTNVIIRGGIESLSYVKEISSEFIKDGGMYQKDAKQKLDEMNKIFIQKNISPGGSADLLAITIFLGLISHVIW
jgi:triphosphoribosyl-dephospho-CoA synthase